jgi:hypothetical protein
VFYVVESLSLRRSAREAYGLRYHNPTHGGSPRGRSGRRIRIEIISLQVRTLFVCRPDDKAFVGQNSPGIKYSTWRHLAPHKQILN